jgi:peptidyl-prolyl cis-trans isomerase B (cyclophilin B)
VVTKKRRRSQLTQASLRRQQLRRAERERRRRRTRLLTAAVLVVLVVAGVTAWVALHGSGNSAAGAASVDYPTGAAQAALLPQSTATTTGGSR